MRADTKRTLVILVGLAVVVSACTSGLAPSGPPETTQPSGTGGEPVTIELWSNAWFPSSISGRKQLLDKFNKEYAGRIEVAYTQGDWGTGETYISSGAAAGSGIACVMEWEIGEAQGGAQNWYAKNWVLDLRPYLTPERRALTSEAQWAARTSPDDGAIVASATVLWEPQTVMLYNPDQLAAAGIKPATADAPWTWEDFLQKARMLTVDASGKRLGEAGFDSNKVAQWGYMPRYSAEDVWDGQRYAQWRQGKAVVRQEGGVWGWYLNGDAATVYEQYLSAVQQGISPELSVGLTGDSQLQAFATGLASIIPTDSSNIAVLRDNYPDFKFGAMPVPAFPGDRITYKAGGEGMVITKNCEHPKEAAEFIFWIMKAENDAVFAHQNAMLPANPEALNVEPFKSDPDWDIMRAYLADADVFVTPFNPRTIKFRDTIAAPALMEVVEGKRTFADANAFLQVEAKKALNP